MKTKYITVMSSKGGVGKSTIITLLATFLNQDYKVILINTDSQKGIDDYLNQDIQEGRHDPDRSVRIENIQTDHGHTFNLAMRNFDGHYDYILIDTVGTIDGLTNTLLEISDLLIIPIVASFSDVSQTMAFIDAITGSLNGSPMIGILNKYDQTWENKTVREIDFGDLILLETPIRNLVTYRRNISLTVPLINQETAKLFNELNQYL